MFPSLGQEASLIGTSWSEKDTSSLREAVEKDQNLYVCGVLFTFVSF